MRNALEFPATAVPMGLSDGKPVGVQIVSLPGQSWKSIGEAVCVGGLMGLARGGFVAAASRWVLPVPVVRPIEMHQSSHTQARPANSSQSPPGKDELTLSVASLLANTGVARCIPPGASLDPR